MFEDNDGVERPVVIVESGDQTPRVAYGIRILQEALGTVGCEVAHAVSEGEGPTQLRIIVAERDDPRIQQLEDADLLLYNTTPPQAQGFYLARVPGHVVVVVGNGPSGLLYGCQELASRIVEQGRVPEVLDYGQSPDMLVRGPALALQLTVVEPPRQAYEYPIEPDRFPWFYDRAHWTHLLDVLFEDRANIIYLWNGHPFSSFVDPSEYPEALEVSREVLAANRELLRWLVAEADLRGIRIALKFYNIHIPLPFAEHHQIPLHQPQPTELTSRYTQAALRDFVASFPDVALYICLGEVLQGERYGREWLIDTIIPGIEAGIERAGVEPPLVILRGHHTDPEEVIAAGRARYPNIYTEAKYNGESLTTWNPRGEWQAQHRALAAVVDVHIANVHILANLEPFRFGAVSFIQRSVQAMKHRLHVNGLHLYPLFYWDWPYSPDESEPRLLQIERDWVWYRAWFRYAWQADRDRQTEELYWRDVFRRHFGTAAAGSAIVEAYEAAGQIAPMLLRRIGITEGNRQTFSLGMLMEQLTHPEKHRPWPDLWESHAPGGERLREYSRKQVMGELHVGETPPEVADQAVMFAQLARDAIRRAEGEVTANEKEFRRVAVDVEAVALIAEFYQARIHAAVSIVNYELASRSGRNPDAAGLRSAVQLVADSVEVYRRLADLTDGTYRYANSMRTRQRKVPLTDGLRFGHWRQCLPEYERESQVLSANVAALLTGTGQKIVAEETEVTTLTPVADAAVAGEGVEPFALREGQRLFSDQDWIIDSMAEELRGLPGARVPVVLEGRRGTDLEIDLPEPGHVLIGYIKGGPETWLQVPNLETDTHADDRGGLSPVLLGAISVDGLPPIDVHAFRFEAGRHTLILGPGAFVVAGVVAADTAFTGRVVTSSDDFAIDWIYSEGAR